LRGFVHFSFYSFGTGKRVSAAGPQTYISVFSVCIFSHSFHCFGDLIDVFELFDFKLSFVGAMRVARGVAISLALRIALRIAMGLSMEYGVDHSMDDCCLIGDNVGHDVQFVNDSSDFPDKKGLFCDIERILFRFVSFILFSYQSM
jgi:hypothetical protein